MNKCSIGLTITAFLTAVCGAGFTPVAKADEGMWLFNRPPTKLLKEKYGFAPTPEWMEHLQKSCVRFGRGGSASLVSPTGLVMTNHHVGRGQLQKLSTAERNLLETGFYAKTLEEELKCGDLEVNILWTIEDVTERVTSAVTPSMSSAEANTARQKRIAQITKVAETETGYNCEMVTLYHGARYHLYSFKRFTDVRLVMAPHSGIASFGGDTDNFEYPRFCLDFTFFRIYDGDQPLRTTDYLHWSETGTVEGDLVFVAGHPGRTNRLYTVDHLKFLRDVSYPLRLRSLWRREVQLQTFTARSDENARIAGSDLQGVQNGRKALTGYLKGIHDPAILRRKVADEKKLRSAVESDPEHRREWAQAWDDIAAAQRNLRGFTERYGALERAGVAGRSTLFGFARRLVRLAAELPKPNADRLREYRDSSLDSVYLRLYSPAPIYDVLEINQLASGFSYLAETFGGDDPLVTRVLAGQSPQARALKLVKGTRLKSIDERKRLAEGGAAAIAASTDPMIRLAYDLDPEARAVRKRYEDEVESVERASYAKIAAAKFAAYGEGMYPDATGSLRLTFGTVRRFNEFGAEAPALTTFAGLYERHKLRRGVEPFDLPQVWLDRKDRLDMNTPFNFVSTCDVIGGNSGSPVVNRKGEVVGLVFDINLHALVWSIAYTDLQARTVNVDSRAIIESLRKIYDAGKLADEIIGR